VIKDQTIDEALIEIMRTKKALEALRKFRKTCDRRCPNNSCSAAWKPRSFRLGDQCVHCDTKMTLCMNPVVEHAVAKRASLDLTRKLADLRAGR
jgi:hypothetical protein